jgi:hypothetical protein
VTDGAGRGAGTSDVIVKIREARKQVYAFAGGAQRRWRTRPKRALGEDLAAFNQLVREENLPAVELKK